MPSVTHGAAKDSSDGSPHSAHADVPLALAGPFDDGNANFDDPNGANMGAAGGPKMGAAEGPGQAVKIDKILETTLKAVETKRLFTDITFHTLNRQLSPLGMYPTTCSMGALNADARYTN